ncbi:hypothetical protein FGO68_gene3289 [Halteria grandinella]|uniref:Uncharacterized protein n=1 Tax=Halteria grandinella TaxID=5974 RepID=A0A8J8NED5_HALGN|nr:hypothetical protein FGO68_gene3289 [Halteria grandinella]
MNQIIYMEEIDSTKQSINVAETLGVQALRDFYLQADAKLLNKLLYEGEGRAVIISHCLNLSILKERVIPEFLEENQSSETLANLILLANEQLLRCNDVEEMAPFNPSS